MSLNPNARSFVFNPNAKSFGFTPSGGAPAPQPAQPAQPEKVPFKVQMPVPKSGEAKVVSLVATPAPVEKAEKPAPVPVTEKPAPAPAPAQEAVQDSWEDQAPAATADTAAPAASSSADAEPEISDEAVLAELEKGVNDIEIAEAIVEEQKESKFDDGKMRKHLNIVFIGHVDAGKSTTSGHILYLTGMVDDRTLEKFEREAKAKGRESWKFAWAFDVFDDERLKGKTQECGIGWFQTDIKRYTILDAPGHKSFVPHMIGGASQADVAILVISLRRGEFETGFEKGGQTREHAMLAKTAGVRKLIVAMNKLDDPTVEWSEERYNECKEKLAPFIKQVGFNLKTDVAWVPISGLSGINLKDRIPAGLCPWYDGPSLLEVLDALEPPQQLFDAPVRFVVQTKIKDMGSLFLTGKLQCGTIAPNQKLLLMPNKKIVEISGVAIDMHDIPRGEPGDNLRLKVKGIEEDDVHPGFVLCARDNPCPAVNTLEAQVVVLEHKSIITAGYTAVLHIHAAIEEATLVKLVSIVDKKTGEVKTNKPTFIKPGDTAVCRLQVEQPLCVERYRDYPQLGRFMLRDEGRTIGVGIVTALPTGEKKKRDAPSAATTSAPPPGAIPDIQ